MNKLQVNSYQKKRKQKNIVKMFGVFLCVLALAPLSSQASMRTPPPEKIQAIMLGDRVVDIAYNLRVLPVAMAVRGSMWPVALKLKTASQIIGCPNRVTVVDKKSVPAALKKYGVKRLIVEKHDHFCLYKPNVNLESIVPLVDGMDLQIDFVDFNQGLEPAITRMGQLLDREQEAEALITTYRKRLQKMKAKLPAQPLDKKIIVINGVLQAETGKTFLRVEAPGGYSDEFLLKPLGCVNVGDGLYGSKKVDKGHVTIRSLVKLIDLQPDAIVITGNSAAVQRALHKAVLKNPALANVPALQNHAIFDLPGYMDSSVIEYPQIFSQWANALKEI